LFGAPILLSCKKFIGDNLLPKGAKFSLVIFELLVHLFVLAETLKLGCDFLQDNRAYLIELGLLLLDNFERCELTVLVEASARSLLDKTQKLFGFHVNDLHDSALHHKKVRIVYIELDLHEERLNLVRSLNLAIQYVLALAIEYGASDDNLVITHKCRWRYPLIGIVKNQGDAGLVNSGIPLLVDQLLKVAHADMLERADSQNEADGIYDVRLARTVEASNRIKLRIES
jgi:hypothetical protein